MKKFGSVASRVLGALVLVVVVVLASTLTSPDGPTDVRAQYNDPGARGGRGLHLLLNRMGYRTRLVTQPLEQMPHEARVWMLLDPTTTLSAHEADLLLGWVKSGGCLIWAPFAQNQPSYSEPLPPYRSSGKTRLLTALGLSLLEGAEDSSGKTDDGLPRLSPLDLAAATPYRVGVKKVTGPTALFAVERPAVAVAAQPSGLQVARVAWGRGCVVVLPGALLCTNYALANADNAVFVTNLVHSEFPAGPTAAGHAPAGTVCFDERHVVTKNVVATDRSLLYYLWRVPTRWGLLEGLLAGVLFWLLASRRLGRPLHLDRQGPVTRASHFAHAMANLFQRAGRPQAAGAIVGNNFRRQLARRLGMSPADADAALAARAHEVAGLDAAAVDRLLLQARLPAESEAQVLHDARAMETVLRRLNEV